MQFGIRQISNFETIKDFFPDILGMGSPASLVVMICIEVGCSLFIMFGFLTRLMVIPPLVAMVIAEWFLLHDMVIVHTYQLDWQQPAYLPIMFVGVYCFLLLVGPGKISVDYFLSLYIIHTENKSEGELEEV